MEVVVDDTPSGTPLERSPFGSGGRCARAGGVTVRKALDFQLYWKGSVRLKRIDSYRLLAAQAVVVNHVKAE